MNWRNQMAVIGSLVLVATLGACSNLPSVTALPNDDDQNTPATADQKPGDTETTESQSSFPTILKIFGIPNPKGYVDIRSYVQGAKHSIWMEMYHLTDALVVGDLKAAAQRGVSVNVILDGSGLSDASRGSIADELKSVGAHVTPSSPKFSITHTKAFVFDDQTAVLGSINLTTSYKNSRDFDVVTQDLGVVTEMKSVFAKDVENSKNRTGETPALTQSALLWSPVNSRSKLVALIDSSRSTLTLDVENLRDAGIVGALLAAHKRGVNVRVIAPLCDLNPDPSYNVPASKQLAAAGVQAHLMPNPSTIEQPYIHLKSIVVDQKTAYVGSVNFSSNSLDHARELGILFDDKNALQTLTKTFDEDWTHTVDASDPLPDCGSKPVFENDDALDFEI